MISISNFMKNRIARLAGCVLTSFAAMAAVVAVSVTSVSAKSTEKGYYTNPDTKYSCVVIDGADYLTDSEEEELLEYMISLTEYTNAIYLTDENNVNETMRYSEKLSMDTAHKLFGNNDNCVVYLVDNEYDYIYSQGQIQKSISSAKATSITDNVYRYSANENFIGGAKEAFKECQALLEGRRIAEPMKYICNGFIGLFGGFIICYAIISKKSKLKYSTYDELLEGSINYVEKSDSVLNFVNTTRVYSPRSKSGGGHGGHGGGHHGGHSGGGHSH